jgi:hypothetical protein
MGMSGFSYCVVVVAADDRAPRCRLEETVNVDDRVVVTVRDGGGSLFAVIRNRGASPDRMSGRQLAR